MNLNGKTFRVSTTAQVGVVNADTRLHFAQRGASLLGRYQGGSIVRGYLVGTQIGTTVSFRYAQREADGHIHGGYSVCDLQVLPDGRLLLSEHFSWDTRPGSGTNVFEEII
jgi:hypothetical protein